MKRFLLACFLLTATCAVTVFSVQQATAKPVATVTQASFMAKVNAMDAYIGAGNMTAAQTTWNDIHADMLIVLGVSKVNIQGAATPSAKASFEATLTSQTTTYYTIWGMHTDLATNRAGLLTNLTAFSLTI